MEEHAGIATIDRSIKKEQLSTRIPAPSNSYLSGKISKSQLFSRLPKNLTQVLKRPQVWLLNSSLPSPIRHKAHSYLVRCFFHRPHILPSRLSQLIIPSSRISLHGLSSPSLGFSPFLNLHMFHENTQLVWLIE